MKKIIKDWKLYFILCLLVLCGFFYLVQIKTQLSQPSKEWSRETKITEVMDSTIKGSTRIRVYPVALEAEKKFIIFWNENEQLKYTQVNSNGTIGKIKSKDMNFDEPQSIIVEKEGALISIFALETKKLRKISYDYKNDRFSNSRTIAEGVNSIKMYKENLYIAGDTGFFKIDSKGKKMSIDRNGAEVFEVLAVRNADGHQLYKVGYIKTDQIGTVHIKYASYLDNDNKVRTVETGNIIASINEAQSIENIVIGNVGNETHIIVPMRNSKVNDTRTLDFSFNTTSDGIEDIKNSTLGQLNGYNPYPIRISDEDENLRIIAAVPLMKGNKTQTYNIREFMFQDNKLIAGDFYTNMNQISKNQHVFKIGNYEYLQWENSNGSSTKILFASNNPEIVKNNNNYSLNELISVLMDSLMALGFALSYLILIFSCIMLPTLILIIIAAVCLMNWVESNPKTATYISVIVHILAEIALTAKSIMKKPMVMSLMPDFMQNNFGIYAIVIAVGGVCFYCVRLKYKKEHIDKSFINQYAFFAIINMILYALIFFPYYYI